jgi:hypothetical protein
VASVGRGERRGVREEGERRGGREEEGEKFEVYLL